MVENLACDHMEKFLDHHPKENLLACNFTMAEFSPLSKAKNVLMQR
jgi:hypothetical protein